MNLISIKSRVINNELLSTDEALAIYNHPHPCELYQLAHEVTMVTMGNRFDTCSIINVKSGNCPEDCKWCAQSAHYKTSAEVYPYLGSKECTRQSVENRRAGIGRFSLVASGRKPSMAEIKKVEQIYRSITQHSDIKCCASLGLLDKKQLEVLYQSGVTTYHCNMETAPSYFSSLCTTHTQKDKERTLNAAKEVGMQICSGGIIGMGESAEQRIELAFYLRKIGAGSIPINILQPIEGTPLERMERLSDEDILRSIAIFRLINPFAYLRFSGGRLQLSPELQKEAIYVGINAAITGNMLTTLGNQASEDMKLISDCKMVNTNEYDWFDYK